MRAVYRMLGLLVGLAAVVCAFPGQANARSIDVAEPIERHVIHLAPGKPLTLAFKSPLMEWRHLPEWKVSVKPNLKSDTITLIAPKGMHEEELAGLLIVFARHYTLYFIVDPVTYAAGDETIVVNHKSLMEVIQATVEARVKVEVAKATKELEEKHARDDAEKDRRHAEEIAVLTQKNASLEKNAQRIAEQAVARAVHQGIAMTPLKDTENCQGNGIVICGTAWSKVDDDGLLQLLIVNGDHTELEADDIEVFDKTQTYNRAGGVSVEDDDGPLDGRTRIKIPPLGRRQVRVVVHDPASIGDVVRVVVKGPSRVLPAARWVSLEGNARKKITLSAYGAYGAAWLAEGSGANRTDATDLKALGARLTYGFNEQSEVTFSVEATLGVAQTGDSRFEDAMSGDVQGDLARNATLGRLQFGGLLRWGQTFKPALRLGIGAQLAGIDSGFTPDASGMAMMESSSTEFSFFLAVGAGVDIWLGDNLLLGVGLTGEMGQEATFKNSVGIGVHLGFAWEPSSN